MFTIALFYSIVGAFTVTHLFTDTKYANMTRSVADAVFRLGRLDQHKYEDAFRLSIWTLDPLLCERFRPYFCFSLHKDRELDYYDKIGLRIPVLISQMTHHHENVTGFLMLDSDVVLRRNVADHLEHYANRIGADFVFQREVPCSTRLCANGGVWWVRPSAATIGVLNNVKDMMQKLNIPDQDALDIVLSLTENVNVSFMPIKRYPNGFVHAANHELEASSVHLVHANWCKFEHKQKRMDDLTKMQGRFLPRPTDSNSTEICRILRRLDPLNLASVMGCFSKSQCQIKINSRCSP